MKVHRTALTTAEVSWNSNSLYHSFFEVFYQVAAGGNNVSVGNTSKTEMILTELKLGITYSIFVVAFLPKENVLPSARSKIVNITTSKCMHVSCHIEFKNYSYVTITYDRYSTSGYFKSHYQHKYINYCVRDSSRGFS